MCPFQVIRVILFEKESNIIPLLGLKAPTRSNLTTGLRAKNEPVMTEKPFLKIGWDLKLGRFFQVVVFSFYEILNQSLGRDTYIDLRCH